MMSDRAARERTYWNEAYRVEGAHHAKYLWSQFINNSSYSQDFFNSLLNKVSHQKVLTIGGGIDTLGISLAKNNNHVVSIDISEVAMRQTLNLVRQACAEKNLSAVVMNCEEMVFNHKFDVIVCKRALHHMNFSKVIERVHDSLIEGGRFIAEEPVCLLKSLRWIHEKLPFHPQAPRTVDEVELTEKDLAHLDSVFQEVKFHYLDFLTRESVKYYIWKAGAARLLKALGRFDCLLLNNHLTPLKYLSTYAIIQAIK
jgi:protein-L-isoaspartate O-methyltransferase